MRTDLIEPSAEGEGGAMAGAGGAGGGPSGGVTGHGGSTVQTTIVGNGGRPASGGSVGSGGRPQSGGSGGVPASGGSGGVRASGGSGGVRASGGSGGIRTSGGSVGSSGGVGSGGVRASGGSGGRSGSGGSTPGRDAAPDLTAPSDAKPGTPVVDPNSGYATIVAGTVIMSGYVTAAASSGSSITLTCTASSFCAKGTVGVSSTFSSWANTSFAVNQDKSGSSGSTGTLALVGSSISVSYSNPGGSTLELQLWDGNHYWCAYLPPGSSASTFSVPFSTLNTKCWDGTGDTFTSGTAITSVQLLVPGSATVSTPFDYCFLGLTVQ